MQTGARRRTMPNGRRSGIACSSSTPTRFFTIGVVAGVPQPVLVSDRLRNVPAEGVWSFDPGAFFGIYNPPGFWFDGR